MALLERGRAKAGAGGAPQRDAAQGFDAGRDFPCVGGAEVGIILMPAGQRDLDAVGDLLFQVEIGGPGMAPVMAGCFGREAGHALRAGRAGFAGEGGAGGRAIAAVDIGSGVARRDAVAIFPIFSAQRDEQRRCKADRHIALQVDIAGPFGRRHRADMEAGGAVRPQRHVERLLGIAGLVAGVAGAEVEADTGGAITAQAAGNLAVAILDMKMRDIAFGIDGRNVEDSVGRAVGEERVGVAA